MITTQTKKVFRTTDGKEFDSLAAAQTEQLWMLMARVASATPSEPEARMARSIADRLVANAPEVIGILRNKPARGKDRKPRTRKKSIHDQASEMLDRAAAEGIARENAKQAKKVAGITFGKGGVTKDQE